MQEERPQTPPQPDTPPPPDDDLAGAHDDAGTPPPDGEVAIALPASAHRASSMKTRMIAGVVMLIPIIVTIMVVMFIADQLHNLFRPVTDMLWEQVTPALEQLMPENITAAERIKEAKRIREGISIVFSLILAIITIYMVGLFSSNIIVRRIIGLGERVLQRIPIIKTVYGTMKQIAETFSMSNRRQSQKTVIIEYPRRGILSMGFVSGETRLPNDGRLYVNIFLPTTPNPTSGYLLMVPAEEVMETTLTIEEAFKFIISGGLLELENLKLAPYRPSERDPAPAEAPLLHGPTGAPPTGRQ